MANATHVSPVFAQGDTGVIGTLTFASQHAHLGRGMHTYWSNYVQAVIIQV